MSIRLVALAMPLAATDATYRDTRPEIGTSAQDRGIQHSERDREPKVIVGTKTDARFVMCLMIQSFPDEVMRAQGAKNYTDPHARRHQSRQQLRFFNTTSSAAEQTFSATAWRRHDHQRYARTLTVVERVEVLKGRGRALRHHRSGGRSTVLHARLRFRWNRPRPSSFDSSEHGRPHRPVGTPLA